MENYITYDDEYYYEDDFDYMTPEEREAESKEREYEAKLERAFNCRCGAFSRKTGSQVSDCICGAE